MREISARWRSELRAGLRARLRLSGLASVTEPQENQDQEHDRGGERGDRGVAGDRSHRGERVSIEKEAAKRLPLEQGRLLSGKRLTVRASGGLRVGALRQVLAADLGVRLALGHFTEVHGDVVV